jgi:hypothetical protein
MNDIEEAFYQYAAHDEDGQVELIVPDEVLAGEYDDEDE